MSITRVAAAFLPVLFAVSAASMQAQSMADRLKAKARQKVEQRAEDKTDKAMDKALDKVECAATDQKCIDAAKKEGKEVTISEKAGAGSAGTASGGEKAAAKMKPGEGAWANFDFVPGERPIFVEDFTKDRVGNFPKRLELESGTFEVVEWDGRRWLRASSEGHFRIVLPEALPERWTMELDLTVPWYDMTIYPGTVAPNEAHSGQRIRLGVSSEVGATPTRKTSFDMRTAFGAKIFYSGSDEKESSLTRPFRLRVHADGGYMKVYLDEKRVANLPNMGRWTGNQINFHFSENTNQGTVEGPIITNISINAGGRDMYDALSATGRVALQGLYFDTGSDKLQPASSGTLAEIAEMLKEHEDLKLTIEGHTDNVGAAQANHDLSHKRAAAVKQILVSQYGIDASRLQSTGFGDKKPVGPNTTGEGRQRNRRVELVKN